MDPHVIEAEVIQESSSTTATGSVVDAADSVMARCVMLGAVLLLGAGVYALKDPPFVEGIQKAHAMPYMPETPVDGTALREAYRAKHISPYSKANTASENLTASLVRAERQLQDFNERVGRQMVLNEEQFAKYKRRLTERGYDLSDDETRNLLLRAGYRPPSVDATDVVVNGKTVEETATFAKSLLGEIVADEVESFLKRADMITRVGVFLVGDDQDTAAKPRR